MEEDLKGFNILFGITQAVGILNVLLVAIWTGHYRNGFAWTSNPSLEFNWHPLLMTFAFIYLYANAIMIYRALRHLRKNRLKIFHASIHSATFFFVVIALVAVFDSHNLASPAPIPNMYSLHSWIGLTTVIIYAAQWLLGLLIFLWPGASLAIRGATMSYHIYIGLAAFISATAAALTGLTEKAFFVLGNNYGSFPSEGVLLNIIGMLFIIFAGLVVYVSTHSKFKRYPRPEDGSLLTSSSPST